MVGYVISLYDGTLKDFFEFTKYDFTNSIDYNAKSTIITNKSINASKNDIILYLRDARLSSQYYDSTILFCGLFDTIEHEDETSEYTIYISQIETLFDCSIRCFDPSKSPFNFEFPPGRAQPGDPLYTTYAIAIGISNWNQISESSVHRNRHILSAHTNSDMELDDVKQALEFSENSLFNFKDYMSYLAEVQGLYFTYDFDEDDLLIIVSAPMKASLNALPKINVNDSDIVGYTHEQSGENLSALRVEWKIADGTDDDGNAVNGPTGTKIYYMHANGTINNTADSTVIPGTVESTYIEYDSETTVSEIDTKLAVDVANAFTKYNTGTNKISFGIRKDSTLYDVESMRPPFRYDIYEKDGTLVPNALLTRREDDSKSPYVRFEFGKLPVGIVDTVKSTASAVSTKVTLNHNSNIPYGRVAVSDFATAKTKVSLSNTASTITVDGATVSFALTFTVTGSISSKTAIIEIKDAYKPNVRVSDTFVTPLRLNNYSTSPYAVATNASAWLGVPSGDNGKGTILFYPSGTISSGQYTVAGVYTRLQT